MERKTYFVSVILPLPVKGTFTYRVPYELNNEIGLWKRVVVQFGLKKIYSGIVVEVTESVPAYSNVKYILSVLDNKALITEKQYEFWKWLSSYYLATIGEVMQAALPSGLKLQSETSIVLNPDYRGETEHLNEMELLLLEALSLQDKLSITEVSEITERKKVIPLIHNLIEKGVVVMEEELKERYKPKMESFISLEAMYHGDKQLESLFNDLEKRAFRQLEVLMAFINKTRVHEDWERSLKKSQFPEGSSPFVKALINKGVFKEEKKEISRLGEYETSDSVDNIQLSDAQIEALNSIKKGLSEDKPVLFHGVTSSGKTEIYIKLIQEAINNGKQVLYLLPEIALTTQIINRLRKYFGDQVGVYHSRYNINERVEIWNSVISQDSSLKSHKDYKIILGPRSALFLPFTELGLIIVDEEHDSSYKQYDPAPRYHARDAAVYLSRLHHAKIILGSATPAVESYHNAKNQKYQLVELNTRFGDIQMPEILVADLKHEHRKKTMKSHFSSLLLKHIKEALDKKEQVILFQNRRGFSLRFECEVCSWTPECKYCDVTLTYHKHINALKCHYCGYTRKVYSHCESCGSTHLSMKGFGTEKVEDEMAVFFPDARIKRMDLDVTRSKNAYQKIISDFEEQRIDILVGTQMVTKGLDFDHVSVVGILNADNMLYYPDFRSFERSFQLMAQVSGRAGRKKKRGKVIIQSFSPYHAAIRYVIDHNYLEMYQSQVEERKRFHYPPFSRIVRITLKHKDKEILSGLAADLAVDLRKSYGKNVLGPEYALVARVRNKYIKQIILKFPRSKNLFENKQHLSALIDYYYKERKTKGVVIQLDIDPI